MRSNNQDGIAHLLPILLVVVAVIGVLGFGIYNVLGKQSANASGDDGGASATVLEKSAKFAKVTHTLTGKSLTVADPSSANYDIEFSPKKTNGVNGSIKLKNKNTVVCSGEIKAPQVISTRNPHQTGPLLPVAQQQTQGSSNSSVKKCTPWPGTYQLVFNLKSSSGKVQTDSFTVTLGKMSPQLEATAITAQAVCSTTDSNCSSKYTHITVKAKMLTKSPFGTPVGTLVISENGAVIKSLAVDGKKPEYTVNIGNRPAGDYTFTAAFTASKQSAGVANSIVFNNETRQASTNTYPGGATPTNPN